MTSMQHTGSQTKPYIHSHPHRPAFLAARPDPQVPLALPQNDEILVGAFISARTTVFPPCTDKVSFSHFMQVKRNFILASSIYLHFRCILDHFGILPYFESGGVALKDCRKMSTFPRLWLMEYVLKICLLQYPQNIPKPLFFACQL